MIRGAWTGRKASFRSPPLFLHFGIDGHSMKVGGYILDNKYIYFFPDFFTVGRTLVLYFYNNYVSFPSFSMP